MYEGRNVENEKWRKGREGELEIGIKERMVEKKR